ncbi:aminopeptidase [candidate division TA06 bacterium]|uniref:Aminopeptidase n=1 Tax=candidate division TA06 bacterium TaxID=2250710 RepID=A0A523XNM7_UNCT6|nr:MAG: aminopeptidase [candidate division TA06 bacterium]
MDKAVSKDDISRFSEVFDADPKNLLALNAVAKSGIGAVALNREVVNRVHHTYSHLIETPEVTNQKKSGRCWLFAGLNAFRLTAKKKLNLEKFELSQAYLMFWDKLEKANFFLENIIKTRDEPLDGRLVMWLLANALPDGGQWDMFVNLIKKYGVVPKFAMPETESSSQSGPMNAVLVAKLREYAQVLRNMHADAASTDEMRSKKGEQMAEFYKMLTIHLGRPPQSFLWEWRDKDKEFHRHGDITPQKFFKEFVGFDMDDMVCLINAPTKDKPYDKLYTVQYLGNVAGGEIVRYLNVPMEVLKKATAAMIADDRAVWFGCDVGKMMERKMGILDNELYDYELVFGSQFKLDKAGRLDYGHSKMTHAMVLTGVDLDDTGKPIKWRVENSWGKKIGDKGYFVMADNWFNEFLYEVTVSKKYLTPELLEVLDTEPVVLPPWDPMGALARNE